MTKTRIFLYILILLLLLITGFYFIYDKSPKIYNNLSVLYVFLYDRPLNTDNIDTTLLEELSESYNRTTEENSFGKLDSDIKFEFLDARKIGVNKLDYSKKSIHEWKKSINEYFADKHDYNVLVFSPAKDIPWCLDAYSMGYNRDDLIYLCVGCEKFPTLNTKDNSMVYKKDIGFLVRGIIHKTFHGLGYHHVARNYKQLTLLKGGVNGLPDGGSSKHSKFSDYVLEALGVLNRDDVGKKCLDSNGLTCIPDPNKKNVCKHSYGSYCFDTAGDGVPDLHDPYPFASPIEGEDSTNDGIIDKLDLCKWNKIDVKGSEEPFDILKLVVNDIENFRIEFESDLEINKIEVLSSYMRKALKFPEEATLTNTIKDRSHITEDDLISTTPALQRIKVHYTYDGTDYYRPFFLYDKELHENHEYIYEKEWFYFQRFGCDIPTSVDLRDKDTYDENRDGLPDKDKFNFAKKIDENYDWDGDGIPDIKDPFPTIENACKILESGNYECISSPLDFNRAQNDPYELEFFRDHYLLK